MKNIPNKEIDRKTFKHLITYGKITTGGEGVICKWNDPKTIYKIFVDNGNPKPMGDNKEYKINKLYEKQINYSVKPLSTISFNDIVIGYEMIDEYNLKNYKNYELKKDEIIYFLKETRKILEYFTNNEIIYGDLEFRNILFNKNTGEIKFCDMDNIQINNYYFDKLPNALIEYNTIRGIDYGVNPYMHNLLTLKSFDLDLYFNIKSTFRKLFDKKSRKVINSMIDPLNFKDAYIIDYVKKI